MSLTVAERRRIANVVGGVSASTALGSGVATNASACETDLPGEDDGNEWRLGAMS